MSDGRPQAEVNYTPYQENFRSRFLVEIRPGSVHLLLSEVGTGKSFVVAGTVSELVRSGRLQRVLILAPAALTAQWAYLLGRWNLNPVIVDGRALRLLRQELDIPEMWPAGICIMSTDLAKRPDVKDLLSAARWDLVIADEAHLLAGQRLLLVEGLAGNNPAPALLLLSAFGLRNKAMPALSRKATVIDWRRAAAELCGLDEGVQDSSLVHVIRRYRRSPEEVRLVHHVIEYARQLGSDKGMDLLKFAASSTSNLENRLISWAETHNKEADDHGQIESLLLQLEQLRVDSRLDCFKFLVEELIERKVRHIVAMCEYRTTLDYLAAAVEKFDPPNFRLHSELTDEQRLNIISRFEAEGGLLIITGAASKGVSLCFVGAVIHYDLPVSPMAFYVRESRYNRYGRMQPCTVYFFEDESGAFPFEDLLLRMARKLDRVTNCTDIDMGGLFHAALTGIPKVTE